MNRLKVLFIDNFDSFTYNLVDEFERHGCDVSVYRNNADISEIDKIISGGNIGLIVLSPGGYVPSQVPLCGELIKRYQGKIPIFGVCLGHECIIEFFGGKIIRAPEPVHGKSSSVSHDMKTIFGGIDSPISAGRYHSQIGSDIPGCLEVSAKTADGLVMGVRHKNYFIEGVQFHPESILTPEGSLMIKNLVVQLEGREK